jgi:hypothetical protein
MFGTTSGEEKRFIKACFLPLRTIKRAASQGELMAGPAGGGQG